ncbi:4Fe-4S ferredoxin [candidate division KSB1 bacterium]|nr:MAG: 4Fe-4S ferredoxin [candidate division KSB1 bacterium]
MSNVNQEKTNELVPIFIMGEKYEVPPSLTIQKAMEYAGYQLKRGCGCRGGICGACATVYRMPDSYRIEVGLACQTVVKPNMYLTQIPFFPANKAVYDIEKLKPTGETIAQLYPEIFKCIGCNTCTRSCPMDIEVMNYISYAIRGDIAKVAELSFDCVMCGLCTARCPTEQVQYNVAILCRRLYGKYIAPKAKHLQEMIKNIDEGKYNEGLNKLMNATKEELKELYVNREVEPEMADEFWEPENKEFL